MDPEDKKLLQTIAIKVEENNAILRTMRRSQRLSNISKIAYWVLILALSVGAYVAIQPYMDMLGSVSGKVTGGMDKLGNSMDQLDSLKGLLEGL
jgi:hypothetical protein